MILRIDHSFKKDTGKLKDRALLHKIDSCIDSVISATDLRQITNLKKMKGAADHSHSHRSIPYRCGN